MKNKNKMQENNTTQVGPYTIVHDDPIPPRHSGGRSKFADLWKNMKINSSILMSERDSVSLYNMVSNYHGKMTKRAGKELGLPEGMVKVWKTEECSDLSWCK